MKKFFLSLSIYVSLLVAGNVSAQTTPTAEELLQQIEERVAAQNPYQALLNDPDPQRSLAAMEVMLESGDDKLSQMAIEFGLQSPNLQVQDIALRGVLSGKPALTMRLDGTQIESAGFQGSIQQWLSGNVNNEKIGFAPIQVGDWVEETNCYAVPNTSTCLITMSADGAHLKIGNTTVAVQLQLGQDGVLSGEGFLYNVDVPVPMSIRLLQ